MTLNPPTPPLEKGEWEELRSGISHLYGKYFEDEPLYHDGGWSLSSFLQNSVRNLSHGFLLCTEASSVNCTHQNNALYHQYISFVTNIVHYKRNNRQKG